MAKKQASSPKKWHHLQFEITETDRAQIRAKVFSHWIAEEPGTPTLTNAYRYDVETLSDGSKVYLTRPTRLNKGADFIIRCENYLKHKKGTDKPPSFRDVAAELRPLVALSKAHEIEILSALKKIWLCHDSREIVNSLNLFAGNRSAERALILAKWFFIEQDVTYWTESGRHKLLGFFQDQFGPLP